VPRTDRTSLLLAVALLTGHAQAEPATCPGGAGAAGPTIGLRIDNDVLGGQDQGYSNGIQLGAASADLADPLAGPCRWPITGWLARRLDPLKPLGATAQHLNVSLSQAIFTPRNRSSTALIPSDRPYAAVLLFGLGYNARVDNRLQSSLLQVGIVGPSARGREAQDAIHKLTGDKPFLGWDNQLHDEGVFRLLHERLQRHVLSDTGAPSHTGGWDAVTHWGAGVGNLLTHADIGGELRWGPGLPDDFGSTPTRQADGRIEDGGQAPGAGSAGVRSFHGFASIDARWVLRDISLDGNAFRHSHRVDKEPVVADFGYGLALTWGPWRMVLARFHRTREFRGQEDLPVFGSLTISRRLSF